MNCDPGTTAHNTQYIGGMIACLVLPIIFDPTIKITWHHHLQCQSFPWTPYLMLALAILWHVCMKGIPCTGMKKTNHPQNMAGMQTEDSTATEETLEAQPGLNDQDTHPKQPMTTIPESEDGSNSESDYDTESNGDVNEYNLSNNMSTIINEDPSNDTNRDLSIW